MSLRAPVQRHNALLSSVSCLLKRSPASPPTRRLPQCRHKHTIPSLGQHDKTFREAGVPDLYTKDGFNMAWTNYQGHTLERLNDLLAGDPREHWQTKDIAIQSARNPATPNTFNFASMAHNNHFFFKGLSPQPTQIPPDLATALTGSFSSLDSFKTTFLNTAQAMFGPGFVWLVQARDLPQYRRHQPDQNSQLTRSPITQLAKLDFRILTTYIAGSPYPEAHGRQQNIDMNNVNIGSAQDYYRQSTPQNRAGSFGLSSRPGQPSGKIDPRIYGGADVVPVLCVSTWEHSYMWDWGVGNKKYYLQKWWDRIDWDVVASLCELETPQKRYM